ncbi:Uncharacterised protein [Haploplasma axanthum]|uniref:Uncharacterized protein n=1 Tax=Haploplasma axanthum TaxID=29552 RepID=A0A449BBV9_HAPAX|nr:Uncharacterised protein [Haploplasma axanthum]
MNIQLKLQMKNWFIRTMDITYKYNDNVYFKIAKLTYEKFEN